MNIRVWERMLSWEKEREKVGARRKMEDRKGEGGRSRWRNDGGENERGKGRGWRRVYKLVIWGTGHVRGSRSLRRRNKSATYDPAFPFPSSPPTDFLSLSPSLSLLFLQLLFLVRLLPPLTPPPPPPPLQRSLSFVRDRGYLFENYRRL